MERSASRPPLTVAWALTEHEFDGLRVPSMEHPENTAIEHHRLDQIVIVDRIDDECRCGADGKRCVVGREHRVATR